MVQNKATITFDLNAPLDTPVWLNTLDNDAPKSGTLPLAGLQTSSSFMVQWQGSDVGAGIQDYTTYVSDNGGPSTAWLTNTTSTSATYTGAIGHTYGFYSIARDLVGNVEPAKTSAEATTTIGGGVPGDINGDGVVDCSDIAILKASLGKSVGQDGFNSAADVNGDQIVDVRDLAFVSQLLPAGTRCQ